MKKLFLAFTLLLGACLPPRVQPDKPQSMAEDNERVPSSPTSPKKTPSNPPAHVPKEIRVKIEGTLSHNVMAVLKAAFETDYPASSSEVNAYDFPLYHGDKGMDWWNFPWDLSSSEQKFTISYADMASMLEKVMVRKSKDSDDFIRYSEMLKDMVSQLTSTIMNAHGGYRRVVKIIYCIRNFLEVAQAYNLTKDIPYLKEAAQKIIDIYDSGTLVKGTSPYTIGSWYAPKNLQGQAENRTSELGIEALREMMAKL
jgi:hypothetical protein